MSPTAAPAHVPSRTRSRPARLPARREQAPRRHLRPVPEQKVAPQRPTRRHVRPRVALTAAIALLFAVLFAVAVLQTVLVQGQLHLDSLRADLADRQAQAQVLRADVAHLSSPEAIIAQAEAMGMVQDDPQYLPSSSAESP